MFYAERFEDLEIWREARRLNRQAYQLTAHLHDYFFVNQWNRSALSVMNNIAEGFERRTKKDFRHFLDISKSSAAEMRSMSYAGEDNGFFSAEAAQAIRKSYEILAKRIAAFQRHLEQ